MNIKQYKTGKLIREFEQLLLKLFGQGKLNGTVHTCVGQELIPVLLSSFITTDDTFFSNHRGHGHYIAKTGDVKGLLAEVMGKTTGCSGGYGGSQHLYQEKSFYSNGIQGGMAPIAAGYAFSKKISNKAGISVSFLGDGTLGEGTLYETLNCAAIYKLPVLFVLEHNGYAQSTSSKQTFAGSSEKRFEGFGLNYFEGDIWNEEELQKSFEAAVNSARNYEPSVIEVFCYRLNSHSKGDDNRNEKEINEYNQKDPINNFEREHPDQGNKLREEIETLLQDILKEVEEEPLLSLVSKVNKVQSIEIEYSLLNLPDEPARINDLIYRAFRNELEKNNKIVFIGEDIQNNNDHNPKPYGGAFKVTKDLSNNFPHVYNTPISEAAITGIGIGIALESNRLAITELMFGDFTTLVLDQMLQHASKFQGMYGKKLHLPFILRTPMGGKRGYGPTHSQSLEKHFLGIYGTHVIALNYRCDPLKFYSDLFEKIDSPTLVVENKIDYTRFINTPFIRTHNYFISSEGFPTIKIIPKSISPQVTIFCYGGTLHDAEMAAQDLFLEYEVAVEIICPTSLFPFNIKPLQESVMKTGKLLTVEEGASFCGLGSEVIAQMTSMDVKLKKVKQMGNNSVIPSSYTAELDLLIDKNKIIHTILKMQHS
jgi:2-oxoisovalerate dehydrogenase E1 component